MVVFTNTSIQQNTHLPLIRMEGNVDDNHCSRVVGVAVVAVDGNIHEEAGSMAVAALAVVADVVAASSAVVAAVVASLTAVAVAVASSAVVVDNNLLV